MKKFLPFLLYLSYVTSALHSTSIYETTPAQGTWKYLIAGIALSTVKVCHGQPSSAPTQAPSHAPTLHIKVIATIPMQVMEVGDHFVYQVITENFFQATDRQPLMLQAQEQHKASLPAFLSFNTTTNIFAAYPPRIRCG